MPAKTLCNIKFDLKLHNIDRKVDGNDCPEVFNTEFSRNKI